MVWWAVAPLYPRSRVQDKTSWSVTFSQTEVAAGEYQIPVQITATDPLGNVTVLNDVLVIDTVPHPIGFNSITADNIVNFTESQAGLISTGTSTAGAALSVTVQGITQTATVAQNGTWSVTYPTGTLAAGEYDTSVTATTTDAAGNSSSSTHNFRVDTVPHPIGFNSITADNIVNFTEAQAGLVMTGTSTPGALLSVTLQGITQTATVAQNGTWSVTYPAGTLSGGEYDTSVTATTTDAAGNSSSSTHNFRIDTQVREFATTSGRVGGDGVVNSAEAAQGITLTGTVEPGSTVLVQLSSGAEHTVSATANGTWSIRLDQAVFGVHLRSALTSAFAISMSFRMTATMATLAGFPALRRCSYLALRSGLNRMATNAGI